MMDEPDRRWRTGPSRKLGFVIEDAVRGEFSCLSEDPGPGRVSER
jgi:hypothetical protein